MKCSNLEDILGNTLKAVVVTLFGYTLLLVCDLGESAG